MNESDVEKIEHFMYTSTNLIKDKNAGFQVFAKTAGVTFPLEVACCKKIREFRDSTPNEYGNKDDYGYGSGKKSYYLNPYIAQYETTEVLKEGAKKNIFGKYSPKDYKQVKQQVQGVSTILDQSHEGRLAISGDHTDYRYQQSDAPFRIVKSEQLDGTIMVVKISEVGQDYTARYGNYFADAYIFPKGMFLNNEQMMKLPFRTFYDLDKDNNFIPIDSNIPYSTIDDLTNNKTEQQPEEKPPASEEKDIGSEQQAEEKPPASEEKDTGSKQQAGDEENYLYKIQESLQNYKNKIDYEYYKKIYDSEFESKRPKEAMKLQSEYENTIWKNNVNIPIMKIALLNDFINEPDKKKQDYLEACLYNAMKLSHKFSDIQNSTRDFILCNKDNSLQKKSYKDQLRLVIDKFYDNKELHNAIKYIEDEEMFLRFAYDKELLNIRTTMITTNERVLKLLKTAEEKKMQDFYDKYQPSSR